MSKVSSNNISKKILHKAFSLMSVARQLSYIYESYKEITSKSIILESSPIIPSYNSFNNFI